jgi:outer membrane protein assembly factor BamB
MQVGRFVCLLAACCAASSTAFAAHRVLLQGNDRLAIVEPDGRISWELKWGGIHDVHVLPNGHILVQQGAAKIAEIDPATRQVVWSYDSATQNGNAGKKVEVHAFQPLGDGRLMIAESGPGRIIEIDRDGALLKEVSLKIEHPHPHTDTRLARKLPSGNYLVCHEGDGTVREYDGPSGQLVWEYEVPLFDQSPKPGHGPEAFGNKCFAAVRLPNGNTLLTTGNGHSVIEVTPEKQVVWQIHQRDLPGITLAWVTTLEVLPNGRYVLGNCHAGPGQPLLVELDPKTRQVTWRLDRFDDFGNNVSNSVLLDAAGALR